MSDDGTSSASTTGRLLSALTTSIICTLVLMSVMLAVVGKRASALLSVAAATCVALVTALLAGDDADAQDRGGGARTRAAERERAAAWARARTKSYDADLHDVADSDSDDDDGDGGGYAPEDGTGVVHDVMGPAFRDMLAPPLYLADSDDDDDGDGDLLTNWIGRRAQAATDSARDTMADLLAAQTQVPPRFAGASGAPQEPPLQRPYNAALAPARRTTRTIAKPKHDRRVRF